LRAVGGSLFYAPKTPEMAAMRAGEREFSQHIAVFERR
jgi:hypothetical protein